MVDDVDDVEDHDGVGQQQDFYSMVLTGKLDGGG